MTLIQTVYTTADVEVTTGLTKSFTEIAGGDYVCLISGLAASFDGYVVISDAVEGHLAVENIVVEDTEIDIEALQDDIDELKIQMDANSR